MTVLARVVLTAALLPAVAAVCAAVATWWCERVYLRRQG